MSKTPLLVGRKTPAMLASLRQANIDVALVAEVEEVGRATFLLLN